MSLRICANGCGTKVVRGRCPRCNAAREARRRASRRSNPYNSRPWRRCRLAFISALVEAGVQPTCGAALPTGPRTDDSYRRRAGFLIYRNRDLSLLHCDHEPPLRDDEQDNPDAILRPESAAVDL